MDHTNFGRLSDIGMEEDPAVKSQTGSGRAMGPFQNKRSMAHGLGTWPMGLEHGPWAWNLFDGKLVGRRGSRAA